MKTILATLVGASLFYWGYRLNKNKEQKLTLTGTVTDFGLFCAHVDTVPSSDDDPWDVLLEPCDCKAFTVIGGRALCEDHRDVYIAEMSAKEN